MPLKISKDRSGLKRLKRDIAKLSGSTIEWGFFEEDKYGPENKNLQVAYVASINEFGDGRNPERSFFRDSIKALPGKLDNQVAKVFNDAILHKNFRGSLQSLGDALKASVKDSIEGWFDSLNSVSWTRYKASVGAPTKPLEFTQTMVDSVKYKLSRRGK